MYNKTAPKNPLPPIPHTQPAQQKPVQVVANKPGVLSCLFCCFPAINKDDTHEMSSSVSKTSTNASSLSRTKKTVGTSLLKPIAHEEVGKKCLVLDLGIIFLIQTKHLCIVHSNQSRKLTLLFL
jgi:hypothetical protein